MFEIQSFQHRCLLCFVSFVQNVHHTFHNDKLLTDVERCTSVFGSSEWRTQVNTTNGQKIWLSIASLSELTTIYIKLVADTNARKTRFIACFENA